MVWSPTSGDESEFIKLVDVPEQIILEALLISEMGTSMATIRVSKMNFIRRFRLESTINQFGLVLIMASFIYTWENLTYSVSEAEGLFWKSKKKERLIIDHVSGNAFSGSVIAIMGESGCGKTTFLKLISGQMKGCGVLKLNGRVITGRQLRYNSIYLQQNDVFFENLTLEEHIRFMAAMSMKKLPEQRNMKISTLLKKLSLEKSKHIQIKYLSGGEKRKLSLASNLLMDPIILFCDEPTSGLDSFNAICMVKTLENLTQSGKLIFLTVHQPSSQIFDLFSNIILLSSNGKIVFQGTTDNAKLFFESQQIICPSSYNPADFYIKNLFIKSETDEEKINSMLKYFKEHFEVKMSFSEGEYDGILLKCRENERSFFYELNWLIWRVFILLGRNIKEYYYGLLVNMFAALLIGIVYSKVSLSEVSSIQNIQGVLLLVVSELIFHQLCQNLYTFPQEINVFVQEKNLYSSMAYYLSKIVSLIPLAVIHSGGFLLIYFIFLPFLTKIDLFLEMILILFMTCLSGSSLGLCLSAVFSSLEFINLFLVPFQLVCLVLSGLWIKINTLSKLYSVLKYISPFYVTYESICIVYWNKIDQIANCTRNINTTCFENGTQVLKAYDFDHTYGRVTNNLVFLFILIVVYSFIGCIGIIRKKSLYRIE